MLRFNTQTRDALAETPVGFTLGFTMTNNISELRGLLKIVQLIAKELGVGPHQVAAAVALLDEGSTVPFIARYRKEATDNLDDTHLRNLDERLLCPGVSDRGQTSTTRLSFLRPLPLLDARALLNALEMRPGCCISANFVDPQAWFTIDFGESNYRSVLMMPGEYDLV